MTTLLERINQDLTTAMRAREVLRLDVLRMAKTALTNREIEKKAALDESEMVRVLQGLVKQREDSIALYTKGGRPELAAKEQGEIEVLRGYLPAEASEAEITAAVAQALSETGATSIKDMGKVVKAAQAVLKANGKPADGKRVSEAVRARLSA
jgi:uncharacterized protein YqeY